MDEQMLPSLPFRVEVEVTGRCDLSCANCYAQPLSGIEPGFDDIVYILRKTRLEVNPFETILLGGEPFTRKDILPLLSETKKLFGTTFSLSTNAVKLASMHEGDLDMLKGICGEISHIQVSLDSTNPAINNLLRGKTEQVLQGMENLDRHGIRFSVAMVVSNQNADDVPDTVRYLVTEMKCLSGINLNPLQLAPSSTRRDLCISKENMQMVVEEVKGVISSSGRKLGVKSPDCGCAEGAALLDSYKFDTCFAGMFRAYVFADGAVSPCSIIRDVRLGNLHEESWMDIWARAAERFKKLNGIQCDFETDAQREAKKGSLSRVRS